MKLHILPAPKKIVPEEEKLLNKKIAVQINGMDKRLVKALQALPLSEEGIQLDIIIEDADGEGYTLKIEQNRIKLCADGIKGAFYGIQTLRQIYKHEEIPCLYIEDKPDFPYRGFYQDVTRGKVPTVNTLKGLIDKMAYYKLNSLQLYVEHTFAFPEYADSMERTGYLIAEEIKELDDYCYDNFIEFIPSLACFGHLYELLQKDRYKHLCMLEDFEPETHVWHCREKHHTIDPLNPESFKLITGMIDRYMELFRTDKFNICCDETVDLGEGRHKDMDVGKLYSDFVIKLIDHLKSKGKKAMLWADILLEHPEQISNIPEDAELLNWCYVKNPPEEKVELIKESGRRQIVCPSVCSHYRFLERVSIEEDNISLMAEYGYKHGAYGVLNTNWGDWGNPASLELCMYGLVLGAQKSWTPMQDISEDFYESVDYLLYEHEGAWAYLRTLSDMHDALSDPNFHCWQNLAKCYQNAVCPEKLGMYLPSSNTILKVIRGCQEVVDKLAKEKWTQDEYRQEMLIAAEAIRLMAEMFAKITGMKIQRAVNTGEWLAKYRTKWLEKNKESEVAEIEKVFLYLEEAK